MIKLLSIPLKGTALQGFDWQHCNLLSLFIFDLRTDISLYLRTKIFPIFDHPHNKYSVVSTS